MSFLQNVEVTSEDQMILPSNTEDPKERRRLLNILAQRRYRDRKRARLAGLKPGKGPEALARASSKPAGNNDQLSTEQHVHVQGTSADEESFGMDATSNDWEHIIPPLGNDWTDQLLDFQNDVLSDKDFSRHAFSQMQGSPANEGADISLRSIMEGNVGAQLVPYSPARTSRSSRMWSPQLEPAQNPFADETFITVPGLGLVHAKGKIVQAIRKTENRYFDLFDPQAVSPFYLCDSTTAEPGSNILSNDDHSNMVFPLGGATWETLPPNFRPTTLQRLVKHHPIIDVLPWPSMRQKILQVLTLPLELRPPNIRAAGDSMTEIMTQLVFDGKDAGGGLRIWGSDPFDGDNWEIGQLFFEHWWWALDSHIVSKSNALRLARGADPLRLK